jgi:hypothetical protein
VTKTDSTQQLSEDLYQLQLHFLLLEHFIPNQCHAKLLPKCLMCYRTYQLLFTSAQVQKAKPTKHPEAHSGTCAEATEAAIAAVFSNLQTTTDSNLLDACLTTYCTNQVQVGSGEPSESPDARPRGGGRPK